MRTCPPFGLVMSLGSNSPFKGKIIKYKDIVAPFGNERLPIYYTEPNAQFTRDDPFNIHPLDTDPRRPLVVINDKIKQNKIIRMPRIVYVMAEDFFCSNNTYAKFYANGLALGQEFSDSDITTVVSGAAPSRFLEIMVDPWNTRFQPGSSGDRFYGRVLYYAGLSTSSNYYYIGLGNAFIGICETFIGCPITIITGPCTGTLPDCVSWICLGSTPNLQGPQPIQNWKDDYNSLILNGDIFAYSTNTDQLNQNLISPQLVVCPVDSNGDCNCPDFPCCFDLQCYCDNFGSGFKTGPPQGPAVNGSGPVAMANLAGDAGFPGFPHHNIGGNPFKGFNLRVGTLPNKEEVIAYFGLRNSNVLM